MSGFCGIRKKRIRKRKREISELEEEEDYSALGKEGNVEINMGDLFLRKYIYFQGNKFLRF